MKMTSRSRLVCCLCGMLFFSTGKSQILPRASAGTLQHFADFASVHVSPRNIDVWLPPGYSPKKKYAVLYMHDGQMLYDSSTSWNRQAWDADDAAAALLRKKAIRDVIIVGIWNSGPGRHADYFPQQPWQGLSQQEKDTVTSMLQDAGRTKAAFIPVSDNYLRFIVEELKPFIDSNFSTLPGRSSTFIAGSSMGGLISIYAICRYPGVFGGAACLSTHWPGVFTAVRNPVPAAMLRFLQQHLPNPKTHRLYFDCGDQALDAMYPPLQRQVDALLKAGGYTQANWITRYFPGADHSENAWRRRLSIPFVFLLGKK